MRRALLISFATCLGMWASPSSAHETIPAEWCPAGSVAYIISDFAMQPKQLQATRRAHDKRHKSHPKETHNCLGKSTKICGIVDDWFWANEIVTNHCSETGMKNNTPEDAIAFVQTPAAFNHKDHHKLYNFNSGVLSGQCVVCRPLDDKASDSE